jgi:hypothetical protein
LNELPETQAGALVFYEDVITAAAAVESALRAAPRRLNSSTPTFWGMLATHGNSISSRPMQDLRYSWRLKVMRQISMIELMKPFAPLKRCYRQCRTGADRGRTRNALDDQERVESSTQPPAQRQTVTSFIEDAAIPP